MKAGKRYGTIKRVLGLVLWLLVGAGCVTLLVAAIHRQSKTLCRNVNIVIDGASRRMVDSAELMDLLTDQHTRQLVGTPSGLISIRRLERKISASPWVRKADLFFDSRQVLWVKVAEREPVARVFTMESQSFYVDSSGSRLPLKEYMPVRLPVFTSCPLDHKTWNARDSLFAREVAVLSAYMAQRPFWTDLVEQVDVGPDGGFTLIPAIGDCVMRIGDTCDLDKKFRRLLTFCLQMVPRVGWNKYAALDARFSGQVIGVRKDGTSGSVDTARAQALLREMIAQGRSAMQDTLVHPAPAPRDITPNIDSTRDLELEPNNTKLNNN